MARSQEEMVLFAVVTAYEGTIRGLGKGTAGRTTGHLSSAP